MNEFRRSHFRNQNLLLVLVLFLPIVLSAQSRRSTMHSRSVDGSALYGRLRDGITNAPIAGGYVFVLDSERRQVLGYSSTQKGYGADSGGWQVTNLPASGEVWLVGFHPRIKTNMGIERVRLQGRYQEVRGFFTSMTMPISYGDRQTSASPLLILDILGTIAREANRVASERKAIQFADELLQYVSSIKNFEGRFNTNLPSKYNKIIPRALERESNDQIDRIQLIQGTINGKTLEPGLPLIQIHRGGRLSGSVEILVTNSHGAGAVFPIGYTSSWGEHRSSAQTIARSVSPGKTNHAVSIYLTAPHQPGYHFIAFSCAAQMNINNIMSVTAWPRRRDQWNDGNDIADLSMAQVLWGIKHGWFPLNQLNDREEYAVVHYGGIAIIVEVL